MDNIENKVINSTNVDISKWKQVLIDSLSKKDRDLFINGKAAVELYIKAEKTTKEISQITGFHRNEILRLYNKCLQIDKNGEIYGFTALIPYKRVKDYSRTSLENSRKYTGAFSLLLETYPNIKEKIINSYLNRNKIKKEIRVLVKDLLYFMKV